MPINIECNIVRHDAFKYLDQLSNEWTKHNKVLYPSFMFIDPFGFTIPCELMRKLKCNPRSELLINIMWRELDMSIMQEELSQKWVEKLDSIFGCREWYKLRTISTSKERAQLAIEIFKDQIGAKWATDIKMLHSNGSIRYFLLHLTDHDDGRKLIKEVFWKCCPDGDWYVHKKMSNQTLFDWEQEPDYESLENWLIILLKTNNLNWADVTQELLKEIWLPKDTWKIIKKLDKGGIVDMMGGKTQKSNPEIIVKV